MATEECISLWVFKFSDCIYDSAYVPVSFHRTKRGALKAMLKYKWDEYVTALELWHESGRQVRRKGEPVVAGMSTQGYAVRPYELVIRD
jgi:hypothetical protein